ncbi:MAG TPA: hypothetical protein VF456_15685 [Vicinamibacterales bacterium]
MTNNNTTGAGRERPQAAYVTKEVAEEIAVATCVENTLRSVQMSESGLTEEEVVGACDCESWMVIVVLRLLQLHGFVSPGNDGRYRMASRRCHA